MKTTTKEQWAVKVIERDGKERYFSYSVFDKDSAEEFIKRYKENCARNPINYEPYNTYEIVKRTVVSTYSDWETI